MSGAFVLLGDVGDRAPGFPHVLGSFAAHPPHGDAFNFSPLAEVRKSRLLQMRRRRSSAGCSRDNHALRIEFDVLFADAAAGTVPGDVVNVNSQLTGQTSHMRSGWNRPAMFRTRRPIQMQRHGECGYWRRRRLVWGKSLFFGLALRLDYRPKGHPCMVVRFFRAGRPLRVSLRRSTWFEREN